MVKIIKWLIDYLKIKLLNILKFNTFKIIIRGL